MRGPAVSVIIPAFNAADYIGEALASVFAQTYGDFEVVVINDGSPDTEKLEQVLRPYLSRINYLKQQNRGPSAARNLGIRQAGGEFLAFLDSDDIWMPEYLAEQMRLFRENPSLDMVYSDLRFFGNSGPSRMSYMQLYPPRSSEVTFENILTEDCPVVFPSCVVARLKALIQVGLFDESLTYSEDTDLALRMAYRGARIAFQRRPLVMRRTHPGSLNATRQKVEQGELRVLEKLGRTLDLSSRQRALLQQRVNRRRALIDLREGKEYLAVGRFEEARQSLARANVFFRRRKLSMAILGLRVAPFLTWSVVRVWRVLDRGIGIGLRRLRQART